MTGAAVAKPLSEEEKEQAEHDEYNADTVREEVPDHQEFLHPGEYHVEFDNNGKAVDVQIPDAASISKAKYGSRFVTDDVRALVDTKGLLYVEGGMPTIFKEADGKSGSSKKFDLWIVIKEKYGRENLGSAKVSHHGKHHSGQGFVSEHSDIKAEALPEDCEVDSDVTILQPGTYLLEFGAADDVDIFLPSKTALKKATFGPVDHHTDVSEIAKGCVDVETSKLHVKGGMGKLVIQLHPELENHSDFTFELHIILHEPLERSHCGKPVKIIREDTMLHVEPRLSAVDGDAATAKPQEAAASSSAAAAGANGDKAKPAPAAAKSSASTGGADVAKPAPAAAKSSASTGGADVAKPDPAAAKSSVAAAKRAAAKQLQQSAKSVFDAGGGADVAEQDSTAAAQSSDAAGGADVAEQDSTAAAQSSDAAGGADVAKPDSTAAAQSSDAAGGADVAKPDSTAANASHVADGAVSLWLTRSTARESIRSDVAKPVLAEAKPSTAAASSSTAPARGANKAKPAPAAASSSPAGGANTAKPAPAAASSRTAPAGGANKARPAPAAANSSGRVPRVLPSLSTQPDVQGLNLGPSPVAHLQHKPLPYVLRHKQPRTHRPWTPPWTPADSGAHATHAGISMAVDTGRSNYLPALMPMHQRVVQHQHRRHAAPPPAVTLPFMEIGGERDGPARLPSTSRKFPFGFQAPTISSQDMRWQREAKLANLATKCPADLFESRRRQVNSEEPGGFCS